MPIKKTTSDTKNETPEELIAGIKPGRNIDAKQFQVILSHYNARGPSQEESLSGVSLYIYRKFPKVDGRLTGSKQNHIYKIECVADDNSVNALPEDLQGFITERFGGGRYMVIITDKAREGNSELATTSVKVDDIKYSPILDPRTLVTTDAETNAWITRQIQVGELARDDQGKIIPASERQNFPASNDPSAAWARVAQGVLAGRSEGPEAHASKAAVDMVASAATSMLNQMNPMAMVTALSTALKPDSGGGVAAIIPLLISQQQESTKMFLAMMQLINARNNQPPPPTTDDAQGGMAVVERILQLTKGSDKESWIDQLKGLIPMLLPFFLARAGGPTPSPDAIAAAMNGGTPNGAAAAPPVGQRQFEDLAARALKAMQRGQDGSDFAAAIDVWFGPETLDAIFALSKPAVMNALLQTSHGAQLREAGQVFVKFVDDFMAFGEQTENGAAPHPAAGPQAVPPQNGAAAPAGAV